MPPRLSREATNRLERVWIGLLCANVCVGFGLYFQERGKAAEKQAAVEARLESARQAAILRES